MHKSLQASDCGNRLHENISEDGRNLNSIKTHAAPALNDVTVCRKESKDKIMPISRKWKLTKKWANDEAIKIRSSKPIQQRINKCKATVSEMPLIGLSRGLLAR